MPGCLTGRSGEGEVFEPLRSRSSRPEDVALSNGRLSPKAGPLVALSPLLIADVRETCRTPDMV